METTEQTHRIQTYPSPDGWSVKITDGDTGEVLADRGQWTEEHAARRNAICWAQDFRPGSVEVGQ